MLLFLVAKLDLLCSHVLTAPKIKKAFGGIQLFVEKFFFGWSYPCNQERKGQTIARACIALALQESELPVYIISHARSADRV